jgi:hypothetical protein
MLRVVGLVERLALRVTVGVVSSDGAVLVGPKSNVGHEGEPVRTRVTSLAGPMAVGVGVVGVSFIGSGSAAGACDMTVGTATAGSTCSRRCSAEVFAGRSPADDRPMRSSEVPAAVNSTNRSRNCAAGERPSVAESLAANGWKGLLAGSNGDLCDGWFDAITLARCEVSVLLHGLNCGLLSEPTSLGPR